ncbi:MAG TPA: hypothetical protein VFK14_08060 [Solirubrobacterales bacterium]|nr:hypothetical protein [Solirubrobacterales bacterium]
MDSPAGETTALLELRAALRKRIGGARPSAYQVPAFLLGQSHRTQLQDVGDPYRFYVDACDRILESAPTSVSRARGLAEGDVVYLSFIRSFAALDKRIGSALSQIAFLPFIHDVLGATAFISLPTGAIGRANRRGRRGSPFALADPFATDPSLGDPLIPEISAHEQYRALTQACQLLGMRSGSIVPTATLSIDSPLVRDDPHLAFWWEADPREPLSTIPWDAGETAAIPRFLPHNPRVTRRRFSDPPEPPVREVCLGDDERFLVGRAQDGRSVTVANAFTDVHPDDSDYAVWPDVAMLNYTSLRYPYFGGADTHSIFDTSRPACSLMERIIEWRHAEFGEDVFLVDLSANIPPSLLDGARSRISRAGGHATFIGEELWSFDAKNTGLDAVVGPLPYCVSAHTHNPAVLVESLRHHLQLLASRSGKNPYLAGLANHDTMSVLPEYAALLSTCYAFLPGAVTLIFSGSEWHAQTITNPEFGLNTTQQLRTLRRTLGSDVRGLFNDVPLSWDELPGNLLDGPAVACLPALYQRLTRLRTMLQIDRTWTYEFWVPEPSDPKCFGYVRKSKKRNASLALAVNWGENPIELWNPPEPELLLEVSASGFQTPPKTGGRIRLKPNRTFVLVNLENGSLD